MTGNSMLVTQGGEDGLLRQGRLSKIDLVVCRSLAASLVFHDLLANDRFQGPGKNTA